MPDVKVSGVLPDVTSMFLDRSFVPFGIQQRFRAVLSCRSLLTSSSINLRPGYHPLLVFLVG